MTEKIYNVLKGINQEDMTTAEKSICNILIENNPHFYEWFKNEYKEVFIKKLESIKCHFCSKTVKNVEEAIEDNWTPSFFLGEVDTCSPACEQCAAKYLVYNEDGELEYIQ